MRPLLVSYLLACVLLTASPIAHGSTLRIRLATDLTSFDWSRAGALVSGFIFHNIMAGLTELDDKLVAVPALARSIEVTDEGRTYVFKLRDGVKWSDGRALVAEDFITSWKRLLDPLDRKAFAHLLFAIEGAEDYYRGRLKDFSRVGVKATGSGELRVKLARPEPFFAQLLTIPVTYPLRKDLLEKHGRAWCDPANLVTLGPFIPREHVKGEHLTLKRNPSYFGPAPALETVLIRIMSDDASTVKAFREGELDFALPLNPRVVGNLVNSNSYHRPRQLRMAYLFFNPTAYPVSLPAVRKAIALGIDRARLARELGQDQNGADSILPPGLLSEAATPAPAYNPGAARQALSDAGLTPEKLAPISLLSLSTDERARILSLIAEQLRANLGLKIEVKLLERDAYNTQVDVKGGAIFYFSRGVDYPDPDSMLSTFLSSSGLNTMGWQNAEYDELVRGAAADPVISNRIVRYRKALEILQTREAAIVPLHWDQISYLLSPRVSGLDFGPLGNIDLKRVSVK